MPEPDEYINNNENEITELVSDENFKKFVSQNEIKNDLLYCQKAIRTFLNIYKTISSKSTNKLKDNLKKVIKYYLDEIKGEIYEINFEQTLLKDQLTSDLNEYYETLEDLDINIDREICNAYVTKHFIEMINRQDFNWEPINVSKRLTENELIAKYGLDDDETFIEMCHRFEIPSSDHDDDDYQNENDINDNNSNIYMGNNKQICEISSSSDDDDDGDDDYHQNKNDINDNSSNIHMRNNQEIHEMSSSDDEDYYKNENDINDNSSNIYMRNNQQISLLKPKEERYKNNNDNRKKKKKNRHKSNKKSKSKRIYVPVSPAVNTSRLNLLQALKKAKAQKQTFINNDDNNTGSLLSKQKQKKKTKRRNSSRTSTSSSTSSSLSSSSSSSSSLSSSQSSSSSVALSPAGVIEESPNDVNTRELSPTSSNDDNNIKQSSGTEDYGKENFLKLFGLYTHEYSAYLIEKRSKRKRRNVQSNEKSDFHYGNLDLFESADKKRKKVYLASPTSNKAGGRPEKPATEIERREDGIGGKKRKNDTDTVVLTTKKRSSSDKSSSSSQEPNIICNECSKGEHRNRTFSSCDACDDTFHIECHSGTFIKQPLELRRRICPPCQRDKLNFIAEYQLLPTGHRCTKGTKKKKKTTTNTATTTAATTTYITTTSNTTITATTTTTTTTSTTTTTNSLKNNNEKLRKNNRNLVTEFNKFRNKYYNTLKYKEKLLRQGNKMKTELNRYFGIVKNFKNSPKTKNI